MNAAPGSIRPIGIPDPPRTGAWMTGGGGGGRNAAARLYRLVRRAGRFAVGTNRRVRTRYLAAAGEPKLHLGCGGNPLPGWLNTDLFPRNSSVMRLDATRRFPFPSGTFRFLYTEHFIEHLTVPDAAAMLRECRRVLVPGGRIRVATPDLAFLLGLLESEIPSGMDGPTPDDPGRLQERYREWQGAQLGLPAGSAGFVINAFMREWGHRFLYDRRTLEWLLRQCGFRSVLACELNGSAHAPLRGLAHEDRMPPGFLRLETLTLEAEKPAGAPGGSGRGARRNEGNLEFRP